MYTCKPEDGNQVVIEETAQIEQSAGKRIADIVASFTDDYFNQYHNTHAA